MKDRPNILLIMADQMRYDTISSLGNEEIHTPNLDFLVSRGTAFTQAYSPCPVCVPARYTIRTGCSPLTTCYFQNEEPSVPHHLKEKTEERCGDYLARTMSKAGYRTFGIGKFHTIPTEEDLGYQVYQRCEEMDGYPDSYARYLWSQPAYSHIEQPQGERTEMYYQPQMSPLPKEITSEAWVSDRVIEQIDKSDKKPFFGVCSFVGPHPPFAPPVPFNRMYDPDKMRGPQLGPEEIDYMDERVRWNKHFVFADDLSKSHIKTLRARYYGEISYLDWCVGRIIDKLKEKNLFEETLIIFTSDHGEYLGDHHAVQKENFFEESCHIPFIVSWPNCFEGNRTSEALVSLEDIFGLVTKATFKPELREGIDLYNILSSKQKEKKRDVLMGYTSQPGTIDFRMMALSPPWKYIFHANGGGELLFNLEDDPKEHHNLLTTNVTKAEELREYSISQLKANKYEQALEGFKLKTFARQELALERCYQMNRFRGVHSFPENPKDVIYQKT